MQKPFEFQLEMLKWELQDINSSIRQIDQMMTSIKNWAIVVWGGSIGISIPNASLKPYIWLTFLIPMLFLLVESRWRRVQRSFIYRVRIISDFLNSDKLKKSFEQETMVDFVVLDPRANHSRGEDYKNFIRLSTILTFGTTTWLYFGLALISVIIYFISL